MSGWNDGKIRAFYPESGKLKFVISDAHADGTTAIALAHDDDTRPPWRCAESCTVVSLFTVCVTLPCIIKHFQGMNAVIQEVWDAALDSECYPRTLMLMVLNLPSSLCIW